ncbi:MAG: exodeoxyribonuclease VII small subunit [Planctomycetia bacterium]|nr:exodeoxyribonuclease VII small subunit [Planctomycetia bacterium]
MLANIKNIPLGNNNSFKKMADSSEKNSNLSFEDSVKRLEQIVAQLDSGQSDLQTSLAQYEEGVSLLRKCHQTLENAKRRIAILRKIDENGQPILDDRLEDSFQSDESTPGRQTQAAESQKKSRASRKKTEMPTTQPEKSSSIEGMTQQPDFFSLIDNLEN